MCGLRLETPHSIASERGRPLLTIVYISFRHMTDSMPAGWMARSTHRRLCRPDRRAVEHSREGPLQYTQYKTQTTHKCSWPSVDPTMILSTILLAGVVSGSTHPISLVKRADSTDNNATLAAHTTHYIPVVNLTIGTPGVNVQASLDFLSGDTLVEDVKAPAFAGYTFQANRSQTLVKGQNVQYGLPLLNRTLNANVAHDKLALDGWSSDNSSFRKSASTTTPASIPQLTRQSCWKRPTRTETWHRSRRVWDSATGHSTLIRCGSPGPSRNSACTSSAQTQPDGPAPS